MTQCCPNCKKPIIFVKMEVDAQMAMWGFYVAPKPGRKTTVVEEGYCQCRDGWQHADISNYAGTMLPTMSVDCKTFENHDYEC